MKKSEIASHPISARILEQVDRLQESHTSLLIYVEQIVGTFRGWVVVYSVEHDDRRKQRLAYAELDETMSVRIKHDIILG